MSHNTPIDYEAMSDLALARTILELARELERRHGTKGANPPTCPTQHQHRQIRTLGRRRAGTFGDMIGGYECARCGYESRRPVWADCSDRHPAAAVCAGIPVGLPALYTLASVMLAFRATARHRVRTHRRPAPASPRRDRSPGRLGVPPGDARRGDSRSTRQAVAPYSPQSVPRRHGADHWSTTQPTRARTTL